MDVSSWSCSRSCSREHNIPNIRPCTGDFEKLKRDLVLSATDAVAKHTHTTFVEKRCVFMSCDFSTRKERAQRGKSVPVAFHTVDLEPEVEERRSKFYSTGRRHDVAHVAQKGQ